ncbi:MAG: rhomboid family intramembrane serine protease [Sphingobacteriales bacterium]|nr:MAG: rhomboid family intramembrane serine protease [Sphingobacteriales bacterium]TAF79814.1 MAG: rhomboid family intramembrane serine protease [Sphingobacteriales bacterium]
METYLFETPVSCLIFLITILISICGFNNIPFNGKLMLHPYSVAKGQKLYQILSSGLVHQDWAHLLFNMLTFYFFAFNLERIIGHWQFGIVYIGSLILCDIPSIYKYKNNFMYHSLGASGAVCGILFSYILFFPFTKLVIFPIPIPIPAVLYGALFLLYSSYLAKKQNDNINHDAHFYGALSGIIITALLVPSALIDFFDALIGI